MLKNRKYCILYLIITIAVLLLFSVRTSPVYSFQLGDYGNNAAATGMLIGKYWLQGVIPYKDLFALGGPLYFLVQAVGWGIAERTGILILQMLNYFIFLLFMRKILLHFCSEKAANILCFLSVFAYIALCCGGDSATEWCLSLTAALLFFASRERESVKENRIKFLTMGILCGGVFLLEPISGGVAYGLVIFVCLDVRRKNSRMAGETDKRSAGGKSYKKNDIGYLLYFIVGAAILCIPFAAYFAAYGCLDDMFRAMLLYPLRGMILESDMVVVLHKIVKCILAVPLLGAGICSYITSKKNNRLLLSNGECREACHVELRSQGLRQGVLMIICAVFQIIFLMLCRNDWYFYLINIPAFMSALAVFVSVNRKTIMLFLTAGTIVITAGICFNPLKNYCYYLMDGVPDVAEEFLTDLKAFQSENEQCTMLFLDTDSTWYLLTGQKPEYRYFTDQTNLASWDERIAVEKESYLFRKNDVIISTEHGWTGQDFEKYSLIQVYLKKRGNICIYIPNEG